MAFLFDRIPDSVYEQANDFLRMAMLAGSMGYVRVLYFRFGHLWNEFRAELGERGDFSSFVINPQNAEMLVAWAAFKHHVSLSMTLALRHRYAPYRCSECGQPRPHGEPAIHEFIPLKRVGRTTLTCPANLTPELRIRVWLSNMDARLRRVEARALKDGKLSQRDYDRFHHTRVALWRMIDAYVDNALNG